MKSTFKYIAVFLFFAAFLAACKKDNYVDNFDYEAQYKLDTAAIRGFIVANNIPALKDSATGIFYQVLSPGTQTVSWNNTTVITAGYVGRLLNGTVFDSASVASPMVQPLVDLIPGFQFGVMKVQEGGKVRVLIPSGYAYGNQALGKVPANSVLDFTIDLIQAR
jgi:FKBP-type peptidyl-prolyl cis-trans isomerase FkpA